MDGQETPWTHGAEATPGALQPAAEAPRARATARPAGEDTRAGVGTLRAILLGTHAPADEPARLASLEGRLDALAEQVEQTWAAARVGDMTLASLEQLQQQVADLRQRAETVPLAREHAPAAEELAELWREVEDLRRSQAHQAGAFTEELRQTEARCRLRQRRARANGRMELMALRRRVYVPATRGRANPALAPRMPNPAMAARMPNPALAARIAHPAGYATPNARPLGRQGAPGSPVPPARAAGQRPQSGEEAWGEVWRTLVAFLAAIWRLLALGGRLLGEDLKDAWVGLVEATRGH